MSGITDAIREQARAHPDKTALREENGREYTYGELVETFTSRGRELLRVTPGGKRRFGLIADRESTFLEQALAILDAGGCLVPLGDSPSEASVSERISLDVVVDARGTPRVRVLEGEAVDEEEKRRLRPLDPAYIRFTSGTTGRRKGVLLSHPTLLERTETVNRGLGVGPRDRVLWLLSMSNHFVSSILLYLRNGATVLVPERHLARPLVDFAREQEATFLYGTPYQYSLLAGEGTNRRLPSVRRCISTATGLGKSVADRFQARFDRPLTQALGIIEVGLPVINRERPRVNPLALGQVQPGYEVVLRTAEDELIPPGDPREKTGEIQVRGPGLFEAYLSPWTPAEKTLEGGYFPTGDQGSWDAHGDLRLRGRRENRINLAGKKFFCEEVEDVLNSHPGVEVSRVYGETHRKLGEIPRAEFVPATSSPPDGESLRSYCGEKLPSFKIPRRFEPVESIPRTPTGKIARDPRD